MQKMRKPGTVGSIAHCRATLTSYGTGRSHLLPPHHVHLHRHNPVSISATRSVSLLVACPT